MAEESTVVPTEPLASATPTLKVVHLTSSSSLRIVWALEELAVAGKSVTYQLEVWERENGSMPGKLAAAPLGGAPILIVDTMVDGNSKSVMLRESRAILQYFREHHSLGLWDPATDEDKKRDKFFQEYCEMMVENMVQMLLSMSAVTPLVPKKSRGLFKLFSKAGAKATKRQLDGPLDELEQAFSGQRMWFAGKDMGISDFLLSYPVEVAVQRAWFDPSKFPKIMAWLERVHGREAYKKALEKGGAYDFVNMK